MRQTGSPALDNQPPAERKTLGALTRRYLELQLTPPDALRAARADCHWLEQAPDSGGKREPAARAPTTAPWAPLWLVITAFAAVYVIWGSTYLAIRVAIETLPPLLMAGTRFLTAGLLLFGGLRLRGVPAPRGVQWRSALIVGALLLLVGNGGVTWAEQSVPSALAALVVATVPLWMILLDWLRPGGARPRAAVFIGLAVGFAGVTLIVASKDHAGRSAVAPAGAAALLVASLCWAVGSLYSRRAPQAAHPLMAVAAQMIGGGGSMLAVALARGEAAGFDPAAVSGASWLAMAYLVVVGALVGFTAYVWLLRVSTPTRVSTYAYVNPLIAVLLGWSAGHEPITGTILLAGGLIVGAVVLITVSK